MRVLVCGGRSFNNINFVYKTLDIFHEKYNFTLIIQGGASGVDRAALYWANSREIKEREFLADWKKHGLSAGPLRNQQMINEGKPELVIAFSGGKGTADMIQRAKASKIETIEVSPP